MINGVNPDQSLGTFFSIVKSSLILSTILTVCWVILHAFCHLGIESLK